ncbi:putative ectonucleoside triphosphate diphosphohydrolase 2-like [Scophthalmus maximus]|uniref:Putative ectonucleoside triphosphate diphosphohydrolase 2-like n=1 Tax=Scophthalmus maximus TaxID=52904 RepID=A0A2U9BT09_SCOMX|nr:putative ectonucleoside triphosphate diphosphohydrolase 2-like [Scophthalmus maximus]
MDLRYSRSIPAAALLVLSSVGILLLVLPAREVETPPETMYGIVLDAGSSHTSMYIYKWPADKLNGTGIVTQHSQCDAKGGGISSYAGVRGGAAESLKACLDQAVKDIPKSRHRQTPLYLGATAGMRLLKINNATETDRILKEVENKLRSYPFEFKEAVILSGQQEGAYGWVTVNYLHENFAKYGFVGRWLNPGRETTGALDLGGASTQITFETSEQVEDGDNLMELKLYGQTHRLYTHSYLCYGQDQFLRKLMAHLIMAFSAFFFIHRDLSILADMAITTASQMEEAVRRVCIMTISEITAKTKQPEKFLKNICATSNYMQVLLTQGYRFDNVSFPSISFQEKVEGASVGWALGFMLSLSNLVPAESCGQMTALPSGPWACVLLLFITLLLVALAYLLISHIKTRADKDMV